MPEDPRPDTNSDEFFKTSVAALIAVVAVVGAIIVWRGALADEEADNGDFAGLTANVNNEEAQGLNTSLAYQHYRAFTDFSGHAVLADALFDDSGAASDPDDAEALDAASRAEYDLASNSQFFFDNRYLTDDGYDVDREIDELYAEDLEADDLNPVPHFEDADDARDRSSYLIALLVLLAGALLCLTLAESINRNAEYLMAFLGVAFLVASIVGIFVAESRY
ncbi:MAG: hypothetical protein WEB00_14460 [Dehalococcoidia bacterium]